MAFSGGVDSTLLLHALKRLEPAARLEALHIDHGLHPGSAQWAERCRSIAGALGARFRAARISVDDRGAQSLEAAAREARYRALTGMLAPGAVLMTAHHGDDQLETVLLRILRGAGVRGLTAIHEAGKLGAIDLVRPLLGFSRAQVRAEAERLNLSWLDDPANSDVSFDRNYLRTEIVPGLRRRWPGAHTVASRLAGRMSEAEEILGEVAERDAAAIGDLRRIPCAVLRNLSVARQNNLLRHVIRMLTLPAPAKAQLDTLLAALAVTRSDAQPLIEWPGAQARIYRHRLYLMAPLPPVAAGAARAVVTVEECWTGAQGRLRLEPAVDIGLPDGWVREGLEVRFRQGGERFQPLNGAHRRMLKQWLQERAIVPWMRDRIPLLYHDGKLVAVADLGLGNEVKARAGGALWRPVWTEHPPIR